jgi:hypothetical protein
LLGQTASAGDPKYQPALLIAECSWGHCSSRNRSWQASVLSELAAYAGSGPRKASAPLESLAQS